MPDSTKIEPNTILPPLLDNNDDGTVTMILVAVAAYRRYRFFLCLASTPRYIVTMLQLQTIQTIETNIPVKITFDDAKRREE